MLNKLVFLIFVFISVIVSGQDKNEKKIDKLIQKADYHYKNSDDLKTLKYAKEAYDLAQKEGAKRQISESAFYIAECLTTLQSYDEALKFLKIASENCPKRDYALAANIFNSQSNAYWYLNFKKESLSNIALAVKNLEKLNDTKSKLNLSDTYLNVASLYEDRSKQDSALIYVRKAKKILTDLPEDQAYSKLANYYYVKSQDFMDSPQKDSALFYAQKAMHLKLKYKDPVLILEYASYGDYYFEIRHYQKALDYYMKAVENIQNNTNAYETDLISIYKRISELYGKLGNTTKEKEFLQKYINKQDTYNANQKKSIDYALNEILNKKSIAFTSKQNKLLFIILIISIGAVSLFFAYKSTKRKKRKEKLQKNSLRKKLLLKDWNTKPIWNILN